MHLVFDTKEQGGFRYTMLDTLSKKAIQLQLNSNARHLYKELTLESLIGLGQVINFYDLPTILHDFLLKQFNIDRPQVAQAYRNIKTLNVKQIPFALCVSVSDGCFKQTVTIDSEVYELAEVMMLKNNYYFGKNHLLKNIATAKIG